MEMFSALLAICEGNSPVPGEFPTQRPVTRSFDFSLICVGINGWVNNRLAGDLTRYCAHFDVTVMHASNVIAVQLCTLGHQKLKTCSIVGNSCSTREITFPLTFTSNWINHGYLYSFKLLQQIVFVYMRWNICVWMVFLLFWFALSPLRSAFSTREKMIVFTWILYVDKVILMLTAYLYTTIRVQCVCYRIRNLYLLYNLSNTYFEAQR